MSDSKITFKSYLKTVAPVGIVVFLLIIIVSLNEGWIVL